MSKCKKCGRHGLFLMVNVHTGLCSQCQKEFEEEQKKPVDPPAPVERTLEFPTVYIGNCLKCRLIEKYTDVSLVCPATLPDFSKIDLCDNVSFSVDGDIVTAKNYAQILGTITDPQFVSKITNSIKKKRPIFLKYKVMMTRPEKLKLFSDFIKLCSMTMTHIQKI